MALKHSSEFCLKLKYRYLLKVATSLVTPAVVFFARAKILTNSVDVVEDFSCFSYISLC